MKKKGGWWKAAHYLEHFPWKPCYFWRTREAQEIKTVIPPTVRCLGIHWALIICVPKLRARVSLHSRRRRIISAWLTSCFCLTPEGPVFISTASSTLRKNETTSNYSFEASDCVSPSVRKADLCIHSLVGGWSKCQVRGADVGWYFMVSEWSWGEDRCTYKLESE